MLFDGFSTLNSSPSLSSSHIYNFISERFYDSLIIQKYNLGALKYEIRIKHHPSYIFREWSQMTVDAESSVIWKEILTKTFKNVFMMFPARFSFRPFL